jgi:hypothetical protein
MAHHAQTFFVSAVRNEFPANFTGVKVLEVGSYDVNGSVRPFFTDCDYTGLDVVPGPGVDVVCEAQKYAEPEGTFHTVISCECFEHNPEWIATFANMVRLVKSPGLIIMTCATTGRAKHGAIGDSGANYLNADPRYYDCECYYRNLTEVDFKQAFDLDALFSYYRFEVNQTSCDLYFVGVRR